MGINRVDFAGNTLIDLTNDTVTPETLAIGITAHDKSGELIVGTMEAGGSAQIDIGLVIKSTDSNERILAADWYGETVPCFRYAWYSESVYPKLTAKTDVVTLSDYAFNNAFVSFEDGFFDSLLYAGSYSLALARTTNTALNLPVFTGYNSATKTAADDSVFRSNFTGLQEYFLPRVEVIGQYWWYQKTFNSGVVQLGSVGHPVRTVNQRPFGSASGSATITVYTTGELLDTISTAITNQAGSGLTFVFKAAEDTTYNGTSYVSGDTMLEITI